MPFRLIYAHFCCGNDTGANNDGGVDPLHAPLCRLECECVLRSIPKNVSMAILCILRSVLVFGQSLFGKAKTRRYCSSAVGMLHGWTTTKSKNSSHGS